MQPIYENIDVSLNTSFKVATYGPSQKCESAGWHIHPEYELVYVKNGSGNLQINTKVLSYSSGALLLLGPNIPHSDFGNKECKDNMEVVIQFNAEFIDEKIAVFPEFRKLRSLVKNASKVVLFNRELKDSLSEEFEKLILQSDATKLINFLHLLDKLSQSQKFVTVYNEYSSSSSKNSDVARLEVVFEFVNAHYSELITTKDLAKKIGFTTNSFCRFFKRMTNKPFIKFVNDFRIGKAVELFNESGLSISEVMYSCGFSDASYFTRLFKRKQGCTPSEYVRSLIRS